MKLVAKCNILNEDLLKKPAAAHELEATVDADYVAADEDEIKQYVAEELSIYYGFTVTMKDFEITNLSELIEALA